MSTFFTEIENLSEVPQLHFLYAKKLLELIVDTLLQLEEIDVGVFGNELDGGSQVSFSDGEFENVITNLKYYGGEYVLEANDRSEEIDTSAFSYKLHGTLLHIIPEGFRNFMEETASNNEPALMLPGTLK